MLEEAKTHSKAVEPMMMMMMAPIAGMDVSEKKNCFPSRDSNHGYPACSGSRCKGGYTLVTIPRIVTVWTGLVPA